MSRKSFDQTSGSPSKGLSRPSTSTSSPYPFRSVQASTERGWATELREPSSAACEPLSELSLTYLRHRPRETVFGIQQPLRRAFSAASLPRRAPTTAPYEDSVPLTLSPTRRSLVHSRSPTRSSPASASRRAQKPGFNGSSLFEEKRPFTGFGRSRGGFDNGGCEARQGPFCI
jgi:hypothetical protein